jgi:hypothetical protein
MVEDPHIIQSQILINDGYKVTKIQYINKVNLLIKLEYEKKDIKKSIEFQNFSKKFIDYINKIWRYGKVKIASLDNSKVIISGWSFSDIKLTIFEQEFIDQHIQSKFIFEINRNKSEENKKFDLIDYREQIRLFIDNETKFSGYISHIDIPDPSSEMYLVHCEGFSCIMKTLKMDTTFKFQKGNSPDILSLFFNLLELPFDANSINGLHNNDRSFLIIIPISNLKITKSIKLGECFILNKLPEIEILKKSSFFTKFDNYACLRLKRTNFYTAFKDGFRTFQNAISLINFRAKLPSFLETYDYFIQNSLISLTDIIFIKDEELNSEIIIKLPFSKVPNIEKDMLINFFFRPIYGLGEHYINPDRQLNKKEEKIIWILYYLNSAETKLNRNRIAAFLDLWVSFDFMISVFCPKLQKQFNSSEIKEIRNYCENFVEFKKKELKYGDDQESLPFDNLDRNYLRYEEIKERMVDLITSKFNQHSVGLKLERTLDKYDLNLSDEEWSNYKNAREKRNNIIHGKKNPEILRGEFNIISKIIYFVLRKELFRKTIKEVRSDIRFENPLIPPLVRTVVDQVLQGLKEIIPNNLRIVKLENDLQNLTNIGMPLLKKIEKNKVQDFRIPQEFDPVLEELINEVIEIYPNENELLIALKIIETTHFEADFHMVIKTTLDHLVKGLIKLNSKSEFFQQAQKNLDQLSRIGMTSLSILQAMKGFERWKRKEKLKKGSSFSRVWEYNGEKKDNKM